jgi:hypothetical protein
LPKRKRRPGVQINKLGLFINSNHISAPARNVALLACLYRPLLLALGYKARRDAQKHLLRQYVASIKRTLSAHEAPYVIAVAPNVGYALCELAASHLVPRSYRQPLALFDAQLELLDGRGLGGSLVRRFDHAKVVGAVAQDRDAPEAQLATRGRLLLRGLMLPPR